jgi:hypothetical protein
MMSTGQNVNSFQVFVRVQATPRGDPPKIQGPDSPTSQLLPISRNKSCSGTEKEGKTNKVVDDPEAKKVVCEELCAIKLCV